MINEGAEDELMVVAMGGFIVGLYVRQVLIALHRVKLRQRGVVTLR